MTILDNMVEVLIQTNTTYDADAAGSVMINAAEGAYLRDMTIAGDLIVAPGVTGPVTLEDVTVQGSVRNFSTVQITEVTGGRPEDPEEPEDRPGIDPSEVYTPSETTGEYIAYSDQQIPVYAGAERSRFSQGDFMWDPDHPDRLLYTGRDYDTRFGIDVSAYQNRASEDTTIDWEAARADGVEFAMVRIGLRGLRLRRHPGGRLLRPEHRRRHGGGHRDRRVLLRPGHHRGGGHRGGGVRPGAAGGP